MMRTKTRRIAVSVAVILFLWTCRMSFGETSQWRVEIRIPSCTMTVFRDDVEWKKYPVAVGKPSTPTPEGIFEVISKVRNPTWFPPKRRPVPPGPHNPLGHFWMGLDRGGYGIHGNNNPPSIGHAVTNGCVRMRNEDINELFQMLPAGTSVVISYDLYEVEQREGDRLYMKGYPDVYNRHLDPEQEIQKCLKWDAPDYPVHLKGLLWMMGSKRPVEVEVPKRIPISLNGVVDQDDAFVCGDKLYLPGRILQLWNQSGPDYVLADDLIKTFGVKISQDGDTRIGITTHS